MAKNLVLYHDKRTGASLMIASGADESVYFPYNIDTGKFSYGMHGPLLAPNKLPVKYFMHLNPTTQRPLGIEKDIEVVAVKR